MKWEFVLEKMVEMVEGDWKEKAKRLLEEKVRNGGQVCLLPGLKLRRCDY